jgi:hypothetical protein
MNDTQIFQSQASGLLDCRATTNGLPGKERLKADIQKILDTRKSEFPRLPDQLPSTTTGTGSTTVIADTPDSEEAENEFDIRLPEIEDMHDFLARPIEKPKVLIEGLLHKGSKMIVGSGSKSFKTWTLLDLALSVATGSPWLGLDTNKGRVLFANFELKNQSLQSRVIAIKQERGLELEKGSLHVWNLRGRAASYDKIIPKILERVRTNNYDLIILDPVYKLYGNTDENSAGDVAKLMNELEKLAVKSGAAVVFSAHFSKGNQAGKESIDRVSGSGVFGRDPDSIVSFSAHEVADAFSVETVLRDFKQLGPFVVRWVYPLMVRDDLLNPRKLKTAISKKPIYSTDDLIKLLAVENLTVSKLKENAINQLGMGKSKFYELIKDLPDVPGVAYSKPDNTWSYNKPTGRKLT